QLLRRLLHQHHHQLGHGHRSWRPAAGRDPGALCGVQLAGRRQQAEAWLKHGLRSRPSDDPLPFRGEGARRAGEAGFLPALSPNPSPASGRGGLKAKWSHSMLSPYMSPIERLWYYGLRILCALVLLFLILPVLVIVPLSFNSGTFLVYPLQGFSLRWYEDFFMSADWMRSLKNSLIVAPAATLLAMVFGTLAAIGLTRGEFRGKALVMSLLISPMIVPVVIIGVASYLFFAPLGLGNSYLSLILVHAVLGVPFVIITVSATLQGFNHNLVRAAASLGASPLTAFRRVTLPLIAPGVISGALFAFATSFDEVVVTLFLAGPEQATLPRQMFSGIRENLSPTIAAAATLLIGFSILLLLTLEWLRGRSEKLRTSTPE